MWLKLRYKSLRKQAPTGKYWINRGAAWYRYNPLGFCKHWYVWITTWFIRNRCFLQGTHNNNKMFNDVIDGILYGSTNQSNLINWKILIIFVTDMSKTNSNIDTYIKHYNYCSQCFNCFLFQITERGNYSRKLLYIK